MAYDGLSIYYTWWFPSYLKLPKGRWMVFPGAPDASMMFTVVLWQSQRSSKTASQWMQEAIQRIYAINPATDWDTIEIMLNMMAMLSKKHLSLPPSCVSFRPWVAQGNSDFHQYFSPNIHETRVPSTTEDPSPFSWYKPWDYQSWHVLATGIYPVVENFGPMRPLISESTQGWVMQSTKITNSCWVLLIIL